MSATIRLTPGDEAKIARGQFLSLALGGKGNLFFTGSIIIEAYFVAAVRWQDMRPMGGMVLDIIDTQSLTQPFSEPSEDRYRIRPAFKGPCLGLGCASVRFDTLDEAQEWAQKLAWYRIDLWHEFQSTDRDC